MKQPNFYEDVKDCLWFNPNKKSYRCEAKIVSSHESEERYNCVKNGRCIPYKSVKQHKIEVALRKEEFEKETYKRLKRKFGN